MLEIKEKELLIKGLEGILQDIEDGAKLAFVTQQILWDLQRGNPVKLDDISQANDLIDRILNNPPRHT